MQRIMRCLFVQCVVIQRAKRKTEEKRPDCDTHDALFTTTEKYEASEQWNGIIGAGDAKLPPSRIQSNLMTNVQV